MLTIIVLGGSHRALSNAIRALTSANISHKWLGPINLNSKRHYYAISTADLDKALALRCGITKSRVQWSWLATTNADTYFNVANVAPTGDI